MTEALERIERTTKSVQAFAGPHGFTLQDTDANEAIEGVVQLLGQNISQKIKLVTELGTVPLVRGDPHILQEVIFNLCTNALVAMPAGGKLCLRSFILEADTFSQFKRVAIEVTDTGCGIPESNIEKIFEPFFTTRKDAGGTGLGLALCRMLISEMDGQIEVKVPPGSQPDEILRLKGKGLPVFGAPMRGDINIRLQVHIPEKLTSEEKELYAQLRDKGKQTKKRWWS